MSDTVEYIKLGGAIVSIVLGGVVVPWGKWVSGKLTSIGERMVKVETKLDDLPCKNNGCTKKKRR